MKSFLLLFIWIVNVYAQQMVQGEIDVKESEVYKNLRVQLNDGQFTTYVQNNGRFYFANVPQGRYSLKVDSTTHLFSQYKIDVGKDIRVLEYKYPGADKQTAMHPLMIKAHTKVDYFLKRESFGVGTLLKNPMLIMMLMTAGMVYVMPKMMENLDEEEREEMQKQLNNNNPQNMLANMFGGGATNDEDDD